VQERKDFAGLLGKTESNLGLVQMTEDADERQPY
jgi:hypothetical protein